MNVTTSPTVSDVIGRIVYFSFGTAENRWDDHEQVVAESRMGANLWTQRSLLRQRWVY